MEGSNVNNMMYVGAAKNQNLKRSLESRNKVEVNLIDRFVLIE